MEIVQQTSAMSQYESQVDIAKRNKRNIAEFEKDCLDAVTRNVKVAEKCGYSLPRGGKIHRGASIYLAKILLQHYGNIFADVTDVEIREKEVVAYAACFDTEKNTAIKIRASKSIIKKDGTRYSNDMIQITCNVASSIAVRNAILSLIPQYLTDNIYEESQKMLTGDISNETKLIKARKKALEVFETDFGVTEAEILKSLGLNTTNQIKSNEIVILREMLRDLKEGVQTVDEMFQRNTKAMEKPKVNIKDSKTDAKLPELNQKSENWDSIVELLSQTQLTPDQVKQKFTITEENIELLIEMAMEKSEM